MTDLNKVLRDKLMDAYFNHDFKDSGIVGGWDTDWEAVTDEILEIINNEKIAEVRRAKKKYDDPDVIFSRYIKNRLDELATLKKGEK